MLEPELVVQERALCRIRCYGPEVTDITLEDANTTGRIVRGDANFDRYILMVQGFQFEQEL